MGGGLLTRALRGIAFTAMMLVSSSLVSAQRISEPVTVDADPLHPVLLGLIGSRTAEPAQRIELVLATGPRRTLAENSAATAALMRFAKAELPSFAMTSHVNAPMFSNNGLQLFDLTRGLAEVPMRVT